MIDKVAKFSQQATINAFLKQWLPQISGEKQTYLYCQKHFNENTPYNVVAIGKASVSMTLGLLQFLKKSPKQLLCISKHKHLNDAFKQCLVDNPSWHYIEAAHPVIKQSSLDAGVRLVSFVENLASDTPVIFLISGGTSALVEKLPMGVSLDFLAALNAHLLASGLAIDEINQARKQFSLIKDGRLLPYINANKIDALYMSDVPNNDVSVIGSGLLQAKQYKKAVILEPPFNIALPYFKRKELRKKDLQHHIIFDLPQAMQLAKKVFKKQKVYLHKQLLFETIEQTKEIIKNIINTKPDYDVYLFGGEATIKLPKKAAKGGRNQHLALSFINDIEDDWVFLSIGTDGTDGTTELAGAWIDKGAMQYRQQINHALSNADSYQWVKKLDLAIKTEATGSNVMDVMMVFRKSSTGTCF